MIILKQTEELREELKKELAKLRDRINAIPSQTFAECEVCGCLLKPDTAFKGNPEVRQRLVPTYNLYLPPYLEDYIFYPYYCKIHIPKVKK